MNTQVSFTPNGSDGIYEGRGRVWKEVEYGRADNSSESTHHDPFGYLDSFWSCSATSCCVRA